MQFTLNSTISNLFFTAFVVLLAWTAVAQGATIDAKKARTVVADVVPKADSFYFLASDIEERKTEGGDLVDDLSAPAERDLLGRKTDELFYFISSEIDARKTEGSDLARRMNPPVDDAFYFVANAK